MQEQHNPGRLWPIIKITRSILKENPGLFKDDAHLKATLEANIPELKDKSRCANCDASMKEYIFEFDVLDAVLLYKMGQAVRRRVEKGYTFTEANQIRTQDLEVSYSIKSRTTQCAKLGFIAKLKNEEGKHVRGMWVVTTRGFKALRGEEVPKRVKVWRGKIEDRFDGETTTLAAAFKTHREKVEDVIKRKRNPRSDYRDEIGDYNPYEWVEFGDDHQGRLI